MPLNWEVAVHEEIPIRGFPSEHPCDLCNGWLTPTDASKISGLSPRLSSAANHAKSAKNPVRAESPALPTRSRALIRTPVFSSRFQIADQTAPAPTAIFALFALFATIPPSSRQYRQRPPGREYLSRLLRRHSLQEIGEAFGGRDHGTVIHACRTVENLMEQEDSVRSNVEYLKAQLSR